jgi:uncharacterized membrane protein (DUF2068 family)
MARGYTVNTKRAGRAREKPARGEKSTRREKPTRKERDSYLLLIAAFKLMKGLLLTFVAIGALKLLHENVAAGLARWITEIRVDPNNHYIHNMLARLVTVDDRKLEEISAGSFIYAGLLVAEGVGLWMRKRWAEYFTIVTTAALIPLEVYEMVLKPGVTKITVLFINVAVVCYLFVRLRRNKR